jgi:hypothetical protein
VRITEVRFDATAHRERFELVSESRETVSARGMVSIGISQIFPQRPAAIYRNFGSSKWLQFVSVLKKLILTSCLFDSIFHFGIAAKAERIRWLCSDLGSNQSLTNFP